MTAASRRIGKPDDSLAGTARYLVERGKYRRGEAWGCEVTVGGRDERRLAQLRTVARARRQTRRRQSLRASRRPRETLGAGARRAGLSGRTEFLRRALLQSLHQLHAGALPPGRPDPRRSAVPQACFPAASECRRSRRSRKSSAGSTSAGFKTDGVDGRTGSDTIKAILAFERKVGMEPADGYAGLKVLARLRQRP